jgi:hypothetical protein
VPDRREALFSSCVSLFTGVALGKIAGVSLAGVSLAGVSDSASTGLVGDAEVGLFNRSAARTPAIRISSRVRLFERDFFSRGFDSFGVSVGESEGACSGGGAGGLATSGFVSRATITSCACMTPIRRKLQISDPKNPLSIS